MLRVEANASVSDHVKHVFRGDGPGTTDIILQFAQPLLDVLAA
jgi:hypothetical protein